MKTKVPCLPGHSRKEAPRARALFCFQDQGQGPPGKWPARHAGQPGPPGEDKKADASCMLKRCYGPWSGTSSESDLIVSHV